MINKRVIFIVLIGIIFSTSLAFAQIPSPLKDVKVTGLVMLDSTTGIYTYNYSIFNPPINDGKIFHFEIDITKPLNSQELNSAGLVIRRGVKAQGGMIIRSFEEEVARIKEVLQKPVIPVGAQPPFGQPFPGWITAITVMGTVSWGGSEQSLILPNQTFGGFILTSYGLPGIRDVKIEPDIDIDNLPEQYWENIELTKQLEDSLIYQTKTLGPTAPPADFKPVSFIDYIISMKHEAFSLGWITNQGIEQSLDAKLENAKKKIEQGNKNAAKNILNAFINEVEAQKDKHLTSEAYGLLKYNVEYLIGRL
ncbi:MAG: hypothetical protein A2073_05785 [Deltaproteobacteria bacterium GWC2_42_11]|nr:MAG: hypothetical protein A2073_05785 [Deltaproteobacteria bacterium GWC2_42_11]HBO84351.1 hypothetical protein [Deltaproteobacteria bacterium]